MSILSSIKAAASRAVASAKALKSSTKKTTTSTVPKLDVAKVVANANYSTTPTKSIIGSASAINNMSTGGVTTPNISTKIASTVPSTSLNTAAKAAVASAAKSSGGSSKSSTPKTVSGGQVSDSYSSPSISNVSIAPSYIPSLTEINTPVSTSEITSSSGVPMGQTNAGLSNITPNVYAGKADAAVSYMNEADKGIEQQIVTPETGTDATLKYIQEQMQNTAEDTRIDRQDIERQVGLKQMQAEASAIKAQVLGTKAEFEAKRQSLIGQGRGIPEVIIGGQQEALDRQEAIKLMPLLAQYQIATDNLNAAQETVSNFIADEQAYLNRVYQTRMSVLDKAYDLAIGREKDAITEVRRREDQALATAKENRQRIDDYYQLALSNGDKTTAGSIASLIGQVDSPDFESLLSSRVANIQPKAGNGEMTTRQNIVFNNITTKANAIKTAGATFNVAKATAERLKADPKNAQTQLSNLYQYVKVLDSNSAVREGETSLAVGTGSLLEQLQRIKEKYLDEGATVGSDLAIKMANEAIALSNAWQNESQNQLYDLQAQAAANGIEDIFTGTMQYAQQLKTGVTGGDDIDSFLDSI